MYKWSDSMCIGNTHGTGLGCTCTKNGKRIVCQLSTLKLLHLFRKGPLLGWLLVIPVGQVKTKIFTAKKHSRFTNKKLLY